MENNFTAIFTCIAIGAITPVASNTIHTVSPVLAWPRDALVEIHTTELPEVATSARANICRQLVAANATIFARFGLALIDLEALLSFVDCVIAPVTAANMRILRNM